MQNTFEALHRPYLGVVLDTNATYYARAELFRFVFSVKNHGPLPAIITGWHIVVREEGHVVRETQQDVERALFPADDTSVEFRGTEHGQIQGQPAGAEVECVVRYRGFHAARYETRLAARIGAEGRWQPTAVEVR